MKTTPRIFAVTATALCTAALAAAVSPMSFTSLYGKSAVEVAQSLEQQGYGPFHEISMDDGYWEVEIIHEGKPVELKIDPQTGKVVSEKPDDFKQQLPANALSMSKLLQTLTDAGYTEIDDVSWEYRDWEVEATHNNQRRELHVDPVTGKVLSDHPDD